VKIRVKRAADGKSEKLEFPDRTRIRTVDGVSRGALVVEGVISHVFDATSGQYLGYGLTQSDPFELVSEAVARIEAAREAS
jgi:hypothetical protein